MKKISVAIVGLGTVGTGLIKNYQMNKAKIDQQISGSIDFKYVVDLDLVSDRGVDLNGIIMTDRFQDVLSDDNVDVVVELIGGLHPAFDFMKQALESGKHVITANKAAIATYGEELRAVANTHGVILKYEASVGGGIPILNTLSEKLISNEFSEIRGILNGTTNYILTRMTKEGLEFDEALKLAQDAGFAEADPTSDIEGIDACNKLCILAHKAFGLSVQPKEIPTVGITRVSKEDIEYANELGYAVKLLAVAQREEDQVNLRVNPALIKHTHPLASVNSEFNALFLKGNALGDIMLYGPGAGSLPTGSAVLGDIIDVYKGIGYAPVPENNTTLSNSSLVKYYIRLEIFDEPGILGIVATIFGKHNISLESVVQRAHGVAVAPIVFVTQKTSKANLDAAIEEVKAHNKISGILSILSVED